MGTFLELYMHIHLRLNTHMYIMQLYVIQGISMEDQHKKLTIL